MLDRLRDFAVAHPDVFVLLMKRYLATDHRIAREKLQRVLDSLPPDVEPPFLLRSQSGFKLRTAERMKKLKP